MFLREDAVIFLLECGSLFFDSLLVSFVLLMFVDYVAGGYEFKTSEDDHFDRVIRVELFSGRG